MNSAMRSSRKPQKPSIKEIVIMEKSSEQLQQNLEEKLLVLLQRLESLEKRVNLLERPTLAYRRPKAKEYESLSDTLDYLHNNVEGIKDDLVKVAKAV